MYMLIEVESTGSRWWMSGAEWVAEEDGLCERRCLPISLNRPLYISPRGPYHVYSWKNWYSHEPSERSDSEDVHFCLFTPEHLRLSSSRFELFRGIHIGEIHMTLIWLPHVCRTLIPGKHLENHKMSNPHTLVHPPKMWWNLVSFFLPNARLLCFLFADTVPPHMRLEDNGTRGRNQRKQL